MNTATLGMRVTAKPLQSSGVSPIKAWAWFGALVLLLQAYVFSRWIGSDLFAPTPVGDSPLPVSMKFWIDFWQIALGLLTIGVIAYVVRSAIRQRRVTLEVLMPAVCITMWWQDGLANYYSMFIMYNSHMLNMGSWYPFVPGWITPNAQGVSEPFIFAPSCYAGVLTLWLMVTAWLLKKLKGAVRDVTILQTVLACVLITITFDTFAEFMWVQQGLYRFPHVVQSLSLFAGEPNQYPLYESVLFGFVVGGMGALFYFRDDRGLTLVERGADKVRSPANRVLLRFLAVSGVFNLLFFGFYTAPVWFLSFQDDATLSNTPSYFLNGMCGKGTQYECPAPDVPLALPGAAPIKPYTGRN